MKPKPVKAIELLGLNLHDQAQHVTDVDNVEVEEMQQNMVAHTEETNEIFNLMARQIKKRAEERVNMFVIEDTDHQEEVDMLNQIVELNKDENSNIQRFQIPGVESTSDLPIY